MANSHQNMVNFALTFEVIKLVGFSGEFAIFWVGFGLGFGLVKKPQFGSGVWVPNTLLLQLKV